MGGAANFLMSYSEGLGYPVHSLGIRAVGLAEKGPNPPLVTC
jgi:hypothetical protein